LAKVKKCLELSNLIGVDIKKSLLVEGSFLYGVNSFSEN
jgi:hypothetical protein